MKSARAIELTQREINIGLAQSANALLMIENARKKYSNVVAIYFESLSSRYRGLIYFTAGLHKDKHKLSFAELLSHERLAVIRAMRELRELTESFPKRISDNDSVINTKH